METSDPGVENWGAATEEEKSIVQSGKVLKEKKMPGG